MIYSSLADTEMFKRASKRPRARATESKGEQDPKEWLKGTAHEQFERAKAAKAGAKKVA